MKYISIIISFLILTSSFCLSETMYITDVLKITFRSNPGLNYKIIKYLKSGYKIEVVGKKDNWSKIILPNKNEGWVLTQFLTKEIPKAIRLEKINKKLNSLNSQSDFFKKENFNYKSQNKKLKKTLIEVEKKLKEITFSYKNLKKDSSTFLAIKKKYKKMSADLLEQTHKANELEESLLQRNIKMLLAGAGILFIGFVIGVILKKGKRKSSLGY